MRINFNDIPDSSFGLQKYTAAKKDLEGIIEKIRSLFNMGTYIDKLNDIDTRATNELSSSPKMGFEGMQLDYEGFLYSPYIEEINKLKQEIEKNI